MKLRNLFKRGPNKKNLRRWVKALRSGNYSQGHGNLAHTINEAGEFGYCCLGVACEVAKAHGVCFSVVEDDFIFGTAKVYNNEKYHLPKAVQEFFRLDSDDPFVTPGIRAASANDELSWSFHRIANEVERCYNL